MKVHVDSDTGTKIKSIRSQLEATYNVCFTDEEIVSICVDKVFNLLNE